LSIPIRLIVGLGNPGAEYSFTRHNAGVWFLQYLAKIYQIEFRLEKKFQSMIAPIADQKAWLSCPITFMNHSGFSVKAISQFYQIPPQAILIVHDELDLPAGAAKLKFAGGHAGHNGLRHIIEQLGSADFFRLRIGVGRPKGDQMVDYVLSKPSLSDRKQIDEAIERAESIIPLLLRGEIDQATQQLHTSTI
jgi:PTH1 family peptidyl-tRNA hydrolase